MPTRRQTKTASCYNCLRPSVKRTRPAWRFGRATALIARPRILLSIADEMGFWSTVTRAVWQREQVLWDVRQSAGGGRGASGHFRSQTGVHCALCCRFLLRELFQVWRHAESRGQKSSRPDANGVVELSPFAYRTGWPMSCRGRGSTGSATTGCSRRLTTSGEPVIDNQRL